MKVTSNLRVLITGVTGYIGENLARKMVRDGYEVHAIIRPSSNIKNLQDWLPESRLHIHDGSIESMVDILEKSNPSIVFHLASLFISEHHSNDITNLVGCNVLLISQLLEAMKLCNVKYLINTGTSWQHYEGGGYSPVNLYAATKEAAECIIRYYQEAHELKVINLHLYDTYGPLDPRKKLFTLLRTSIDQQKILEMSAGRQKIDLVYIDDVLESYCLAMRLLMESPNEHSGVYGVSSGAPIQLKELVEVYFKLANQRAEISWGARPYRKREVMDTWKCEGLPGWTPKVSLEEGIKKLLDSNSS
jgi:nucleoside-diphosphate-sugar epimerase